MMVHLNTYARVPAHLDDAARHGANVRAAVAPDLCLVAHAPQRNTACTCPPHAPHPEALFEKLGHMSGL